MTLTFRLSDLYLIKKETLATSLLYLGILIAFLGSLNPWFMWPIGKLYPIPAAFLIIGSYLVSRQMENPIYTRDDFMLPLLAFTVYVVYERVSTNANFSGFAMILFRLPIFLSLFWVKLDKLRGLLTFISKVMGTLLAISLVGHILYIMGFPFPGSNAQYGEFYSFTNHYLFLLDDRNLFILFPRFNSYFLEPGHIGTCCAFLLFAQRGQWKKWYNIVMIISVFFTFSLAAYVYMVVIVFLNLWINGQQVFKKLFGVLAFLGLGIWFSFVYNGGDNLVHDLIMLRLEIDDGEMAGDNRVTDTFETDFDNFLSYSTASEYLFGRDIETAVFGNSGYRVFIYEHGFVGLFLIIAVYFISMMYSPDKRAFVSVLFVSALYFWVTAFMLWENVFIPLYAAAYPILTARDITNDAFVNAQIE